jgi:hypothetical protein
MPRKPGITKSQKGSVGGFKKPCNSISKRLYFHAQEFILLSAYAFVTRKKEQRGLSVFVYSATTRNTINILKGVYYTNVP